MRNFFFPIPEQAFEKQLLSSEKSPEKRLILRNQMHLKRSIYICSLKLAEFLKRFPFFRRPGNEKPNP